MMSGNIFFLIYICSLKKQLSFFFPVLLGEIFLDFAR